MSIAAASLTVPISVGQVSGGAVSCRAKAVESSQLARRGHFEQRAATTLVDVRAGTARATLRGCFVEVPVCALNQRRPRVSTVITSKVVKRGLNPKC